MNRNINPKGKTDEWTLLECSYVFVKFALREDSEAVKELFELCTQPKCPECFLDHLCEHPCSQVAQCAGHYVDARVDSRLYEDWTREEMATNIYIYKKKK